MSWRLQDALNHPHIVTVYDVGRAESLSYIAMELVEGRTLRELLVAGPLPPKRAVAIAHSQPESELRGFTSLSMAGKTDSTDLHGLDGETLPRPGAVRAGGRPHRDASLVLRGRLVSDGDPALAFGPRPGVDGTFSWANGSRLTSNFGAAR